MVVENLPDDTIWSTVFPTIWGLLKVYVIIPFSESIVERGFSKMNLIMAKKMCSCYSVSVDTLIQILFWKKKLESHEIEKVIDIWNKANNKIIFSMDL